MAEKFALKAEKREMSKQSARETRANSRVPAVVYGGGEESTPISLGASDILRTYRKAGQSSMIDLEIDGKEEMVIIHDVQVHPVRSEIWHVDLKRLSAGETTDVNVPIITTGESPAVKVLGGVMNIAHETISIRCLPKDIPHDITVDISTLAEIHDHITIADLKLDPKKVEVMGLEPDEVIVTIAGKQVEEEIPEGAPEDTVDKGEDAAEGGE